MVEVALIVVPIIIFLLFVALNIYFVIYFQHPGEYMVAARPGSEAAGRLGQRDGAKRKEATDAVLPSSQRTRTAHGGPRFSS